MKLSTLIIATACLLTVSTAVSAQTSFISLKGITTTTPTEITMVSSIKFNLLGIANGKVKVKMYNEPKGSYTVQVTDVNGNKVGVKEITHEDGSTIENVDFSKTFQDGTYKITVFDANNNKLDETVMLLM